MTTTRPPLLHPSRTRSGNSCRACRSRCLRVPRMPRCRADSSRSCASDDRSTRSHTALRCGTSLIQPEHPQTSHRHPHPSARIRGAGCVGSCRIHHRLFLYIPPFPDWVRNDFLTDPGPGYDICYAKIDKAHKLHNDLRRKLVDLVKETDRLRETTLSKELFDFWNKCRISKMKSDQASSNPPHI